MSETNENPIKIIEDLGYRIISRMESPVATGGFAECYLIYKENQSSKQLYIFKYNCYLENKSRDYVKGIPLSPNLYYYDDDLAMLIMDYIPGITLNSLVYNIKDVKLKLKDYQILSILYSTAYGLNVLKTKGWVHRAIKPDNIMIDGNFCAHIIDYGEMDRGAADTYKITDKYRNYEALFGKYSFETDLYSFGCLIFFMLFQDHPFNGLKDDDLKRLKALNQFDSSLPLIKHETDYYNAVKELHSYIEPSNCVKQELLILIRRCCKLYPYKKAKISIADIISEIQRLAVEYLSPDDFDKYDYVVRIANSKTLSLGVPFGTEYLVNQAVKLGFHTVKQGGHPVFLAKKLFDPQFSNSEADSETFRNLFEEATS